MSRERRVALLSIDPAWADATGDFVPFTYGIRKLEASLRSDPSLEDVEVQLIDRRSFDPDEFFEAIVEFRPTLIGASVYLWSLLPFMEVARKVRRFDPSIRIVLGGPHARASVLQMPRYAELAQLVDAVVPGEGEELIRVLARHHLDDDWQTRPGLLVPHLLGWRSTGEAEPVRVDEYPTPYHLDMAPDGVTGYFETFRGCPIHCSFCQWGASSADRIFSAEYLTAHLEGLRRAKVPNALSLDAAFNLSPRAFRNLVAAEEATGVLTGLEVRGHLYPTFLTDEHLDFLRRFEFARIAIGIQSFDPEVLHEVGRPFDLDRFERVAEAVRPHFPLEFEIMLGLPGDNPASFRRTLHKAVEMGDSVRIFWTRVLPDALLDRAAADHAIVFDPETWLLESCKGWSPEDLRDAFEYTKRVAREHSQVHADVDWVGFQITRGDDRPTLPRPLDVPEVRVLDPDVVERVRLAVADHVDGWRLRTVRQVDPCLLFDLDAPPGQVVLEARPRGAEPFFVAKDELAYSHRGSLDPEYVDGLRSVIDAVHPEARGLLAKAA